MFLCGLFPVLGDEWKIHFYVALHFFYNHVPQRIHSNGPT